MDPDTEVQFQILPFLRVYKSGRFERLIVPDDHVPPALHPATGAAATKDVVIDPNAALWARLYLPAGHHPPNKLPLLLYFHGGGFCLGSAASPLYHNYLSSLVARANVIAVSVDYRLAPEHPIPAAYEDALAALRWATSSHAEEWLTRHADFNRVFLAGDSAGANIAHNVAMRGPSVEGVALVHPYFWGERRLAEETAKGDGERQMLSVALLDAQWPTMCPGAEGGNDDPRVNPLGARAPGLEGLGCKRVLVCVAGRDLLHARGRAYYEAVKRCGWGGEAEVVETEGEDHVFHLFKPDSEKAAALMERLVAFFNNE